MANQIVSEADFVPGARNLNNAPFHLKRVFGLGAASLDNIRKRNTGQTIVYLRTPEDWPWSSARYRSKQDLSARTLTHPNADRVSPLALPQA